MSAPPRTGYSAITRRQAPACRSGRRALQFGVSLLAIAAALTPAAWAQTTVAPGATVTNNTTTTGYYILTGNGGTLDNSGTIAPPSAVAVRAEIRPFAMSDLSTYRISGISLVNSGLISVTSTKALKAISIDGLTVSNTGTIENTGTVFPTLYMHNINNLQLSNTGLISVNNSGTSGAVADLYNVTNSTLSNLGTILVASTTDSSAALFLSAHSTNITITNSGTISTVGKATPLAIGNNGLGTFTTTVDGTSVTLDPVATNITVNNSGLLSANNTALVVGGTASVVAVTNSGTITTTSASGANAITVSNAASEVAIANSGLVVNAGSGSAIDVSTTGTGLNIGNTGTITELAGNSIAIDHVNGTQPLAITSSGIINGNIRLSQPGDTLGITGGAINGAVTASNPGAGTVTFNAPGGFTTGGDIGTTSNPIGAIVIAGGTLNNNNLLTANSISLAPTATNVTLNNSGLLASSKVALGIGGTSSAVAVINSGAIVTAAASGANAIAVSNAASQVNIVNSGLVLNVGAGSAIDVSTTGTGVTIGNTGTITELTGNSIAIDHVNGTAPLAINTSGIVNGGIRLSQPGDTLGITGGAINGAVIASNPGAGTVTFNAPGGFTTGGDFGTAGNPLGAIVIAGGALDVNNALIANTVTFGAGSTTTLMSTVNAVANNGNLNLAGGTLSLGTNALVLGANATIRTSTADGSTINLTIAGGQNGMINARAGNATVDTSANTLVIRPNLAGILPKMGAEYAVIATSAGANVGNALTRLSIAPGPTAALFSIGTATTTTDAFGNALTPGKDIVLTVTGGSGTLVNAEVAASDPQIERAQVNAMVTAITERIGDAVADAIAGSIGVAPSGGISGGDAPGHNWSVWVDTSGSYLSNNSAGGSYNGSIWTGLAGVDQLVTDNIIAGAVIGGEGNSFKLTGSGGLRSGTGISITPYAAYILRDWASVDVELSYARLDNSVSVTGVQQAANHYQTNRVFAAGNLTGYWSIDALTLRAKVGLLTANNGGPSYTDSTGVRTRPASTSLLEAKLGGEATYHFGQFEPFVNLTLADDLRGSGGLNSSVTGVRSPSRYGLQYDAGLRYKTEGGIQVGFQAGGETLRGSQSSVMGGLFARIPL